MPAAHTAPHRGRLTRFSLSLRRSLRAAVALTCAALAAAEVQADDTLDKVRQRGKLAVGVILTGEAFGSLDPATQQPVGYQVDLAREVARRLGVAADIVPVGTANRVQFLLSGKVDLLLANFVRTPEREERLGLIPTAYYQTGGMLLTRKDSGIAQLPDVRGKTICVSQGSSFAKPLEQQHGAVIKGLKTSAESLLVLQGGTCAGAVHASSVIAPLVAGGNAEWAAYHIAVSDIDPSPWVAAARKGERDTVAAVDGIFQQLHANGFFLATEAKYKIVPHAKALDAWQKQFAKAAP